MSDTKDKPVTIGEATNPVESGPSPEVEAWQDDQTRKAIEEADAGDFATPEQVKATVRKFAPKG